MKKYNVLENFVHGRFTLLLIVYSGCFIGKYLLYDNDPFIINKILIKIISYLCPISGSLLFWEFFRLYHNKNILDFFAYIGRQSLEIYILHICFVIQIDAVGDFWLNQSYITCVMIQMLYAVLVASLAIFCSIIIANFLKTSSFLSRVLFGIY